MKKGYLVIANGGVYEDKWEQPVAILDCPVKAQLLRQQLEENMSNERRYLYGKKMDAGPDDYVENYWVKTTYEDLEIELEDWDTLFFNVQEVPMFISEETYADIRV